LGQPRLHPLAKHPVGKRREAEGSRSTLEGLPPREDGCTAQRTRAGAGERCVRGGEAGCKSLLLPMDELA
jgi:hypothetical protein